MDTKEQLELDVKIGQSLRAAQHVPFVQVDGPETCRSLDAKGFEVSNRVRYDWYLRALLDTGLDPFDHAFMVAKGLKVRTRFCQV